MILFNPPPQKKEFKFKTKERGTYLLYWFTWVVAGRVWDGKIQSSQKQADLRLYDLFNGYCLIIILNPMTKKETLSGLILNMSFY